MSDFFEPKRVHRWVLTADRLKPHLVQSLRHGTNLFGDTLTIDFILGQDDDLSCPLDRNGSGNLRFLDGDGVVTDEYDIHWDGVRHIPFLELDHTTSANMVGRVVLGFFRLKKRV